MQDEHDPALRIQNFIFDLARGAGELLLQARQWWLANHETVVRDTLPAFVDVAQGLMAWDANLKREPRFRSWVERHGDVLDASFPDLDSAWREYVEHGGLPPGARGVVLAQEGRVPASPWADPETEELDRAAPPWEYASELVVSVFLVGLGRHRLRHRPRSRRVTQR